MYEVTHCIGLVSYLHCTEEQRRKHFAISLTYTLDFGRTGRISSVIFKTRVVWRYDQPTRPIYKSFSYHSIFHIISFILTPSLRIGPISAHCGISTETKLIAYKEIYVPLAFAERLSHVLVRVRWRQIYISACK